MLNLPRLFPALSREKEGDFLLEYNQKSIVILRFAIPLAIILYIVFFFWDYMHDSETIWIKFSIRISFILLSFVIFFLTFFSIFSKHLQLIMVSFLIAAGLGVSIVLGYTKNGFDVGIAGVLLVIMYGCGFARLLFWPALLMTLITIISSNIFMIIFNQSEKTLLNANFFIISASAIAVTYAYFLEIGERSSFYYKTKFFSEKEKADDVLRRFIPIRMLERIEKGNTHIAEAHGEATVVFTDLVGFTGLSKKLSPSHLVEILSDIFTLLDDLAERYEVETIKTIGDSYMAAAVVEIRGSNSAERVADFAIAALDSVNAYALAKNLPIKMRVGMATGAVVSGVIGKNKPIYDLWGQTVNEASRLESEGVEGVVLVTEATYWRLRNNFSFDEYGMIRINAENEVKAFRIIGRKS